MAATTEDEESSRSSIDLDHEQALRRRQHGLFQSHVILSHAMRALRFKLTAPKLAWRLLFSHLA